jgi:hypothetical protein
VLAVVVGALGTVALRGAFRPPVVEDGASVSIWIDELRTLVEFLRSKGVELDPLRDKQRKLAWALAQSLGPRPIAEAPRP